MRWFKQSSDSTAFDWKPLTSEEQFNQLLSEEGPLAIFKHSTRCSISSMAKNRVERDWKSDSVPVYLIDVIQHRNVSNLIASALEVIHQSPQLILVQNGAAVHHASHNGISANAALSAI